MVILTSNNNLKWALIFVVNFLLCCKAIPKLSFRTAGGLNTPIEKYPYQVFIEYLGGHHCGGSILNSVTILTAAHCLELADQKDLRVRAGVSDLDNEDEGQSRTILKKIVHPNWDNKLVLNDIGLLILSEPLKFTKTVQPINLPENGENLPKPGTPAYTGGWGLLADGTFPSKLQYLETEIRSEEECRIFYNSPIKIDERTICAGKQNTGHLCSSDSGGPLMIYDEKTGKPKIVGVLSFGLSCETEGVPDGFTRVATFRKWIDKNIAKEKES